MLRQRSAQWYPQVNKRFFVIGSVGVAWLQEEGKDEYGESWRNSLVTPTLGASIGYDIRSRRRFLLTPFASVARLLDMRGNGNAGGRAAGTMVQVGVGFTRY